MINRHEGKSRIDVLVDHVELQSVDRIDRLPVRQGSSTEWINANLETGAPNRLHVHDVFEIANEPCYEVLLMGGRQTKRLVVCNSFYRFIIRAQQIVCPVLYPARNVRIGGTAVRRVVLETSIFRRIVGWCNDNPIGEVLSAPAVIDQNGVRNDGCGSYSVTLLNDGLDTICCQYFERRSLRRPGNRMGVFPHI